MNTKETIRKVLFAMLWLTIGGGMLTLLIAAISKKNREVCSGYTITIKGVQNNFFMDEKDINRLLTAATGGDIKGVKMSTINLRQLEQLLEDNVWIRDAELWFDNKEVLHIKVNEREPVARIFTTAGNSFYIDSSEKRMPLSDKMSARVPVFTGFPDKKTLQAKDKLLLKDVKRTAVYIMNDSFWRSQVAQIDITPERNFEMVPVLGNHIIKLGSGKEIDKKFERLMIFYKQVMSKTGFDVYSTLDVQYEGQVIGTRKGTGKAIVDSAQLKKNVEKLLMRVQQMQSGNPQPLKGSSETDLSKEENIINTNLNASKIEKPTIKADSVKTNITGLKATSTPSTNPNPVKTTSLPKTNENKPKAVMPEKTSN